MDIEGFPLEPGKEYYLGDMETKYKYEGEGTSGAGQGATRRFSYWNKNLKISHSRPLSELDKVNIVPVHIPPTTMDLFQIKTSETLVTSTGRSKIEMVSKKENCVPLAVIALNLIDPMDRKFFMGSRNRKSAQPIGSHDDEILSFLQGAAGHQALSVSDAFAIKDQFATVFANLKVGYTAPVIYETIDGGGHMALIQRGPDGYRLVEPQNPYPEKEAPASLEELAGRIYKWDLFKVVLGPTLDCVTPTRLINVTPPTARPETPPPRTPPPGKEDVVRGVLPGLPGGRRKTQRNRKTLLRKHKNASRKRGSVHRR